MPKQVLSPSGVVAKKGPYTNPLTPDDKATIVALRDENLGIVDIAHHIGRDPSVVSRFLSKFRSTKAIAKAYFEAQALTLARRVVREADVDQSMDVLDRIDVLPKRQQDATGSSLNIVIGAPAAPAPEKVVEARVVREREEKEGSRGGPPDNPFLEEPEDF